MSSVDIQRAFNEAASGHVCTKATLRYSNGTHQVLRLDGRNDSGEPFSVESEPFLGDPARQARELASELKLKRVIGLSFMGNLDREITKEQVVQNAMSSDVRRVTNTIADLKQLMSARAEKLRAGIQQATADLNVTFEKAEAFEREIRAADAELNAMLAPEGNGAPE